VSHRKVDLYSHRKRCQLTPPNDCAVSDNSIVYRKQFKWWMKAKRGIRRSQTQEESTQCRNRHCIEVTSTILQRKENDTNVQYIQADFRNLPRLLFIG
jgi:hypothetical protein